MLNSILIVGGTGLIGYHTAITLLKHNFQVSILSRHTGPFQKYFPYTTRFHDVDIADLAQSQPLMQALQGIDTLIYATGADSRTIPPAPAYSYFYQQNVAICANVLQHAREAGIKRVIIMGSYFTYLDRLWPDLKLAQTHPYIRSRQEQMTMALALNSENFQVSIIEIPYVIGAMPGRKPLWTPLIKYLRTPFLPHFTAHGGTAIITAKHLARAIQCIIETAAPKTVYPLGEKNLPWQEFNKLFCLGLSPRKDIFLPDWLVKLGMSLTQFYKLLGKEPSLKPDYAKVMLRNSYLDVSEYFNLTGDYAAICDLEMRESFQETIRASYV